MTKDKKYMYVGIGLLLVTLVLSGVTYAVLTWTSTKTNIGINTDCFTIDYTKGNNITGKLKLVDIGASFIPNDDGNTTFLIQEGMGMSYVNLGIKSTCNIEGTGSIYLNVTELSDTFKEGGDSYGALGYAVLKNTSDLEDKDINIANLKDQAFELIDFHPITETGKIKIHEETLSNTELNKYLIVIFIDSQNAGNDVLSATFKGNISAEATQSVPYTPDYCFTTNVLSEENKTAEIETYNCYADNTNNYKTITDVVIPPEINGYQITTISRGSFCSRRYGSYGDIYCEKGNNITSIVIPDTITTIESYAFEYNNLTNVIIPNSVTKISIFAFDNNQLTNVILPDSLTTIEDSVFAHNKLTNITIPDSVTTIENNAFYDNQLTTISIPTSITTIGTGAFYNNKLTSIEIPSSVTAVVADSFGLNPLTKITVDPDNSVYDSRDNSNAIIETASNTLIKGCKNTIIPSSVTEIGSNAFSLSQLTNVIIPDSIITIGYSAFSGNQLTSIAIPASVTTIELSAFENNNLSHVYIENGSNLISIGRRSFSSSDSTYTAADGTIYVNNPNLKKIYYNGSNALTWRYAIDGKYANSAFITGTVEITYDTGVKYREVQITTGSPS